MAADPYPEEEYHIERKAVPQVQYGLSRSAQRNIYEVIRDDIFNHGGSF